MEQQSSTQVKVDTVYTESLAHTHPSAFAKYIEEMIQERIEEGYSFQQFIPAAPLEKHETSQCYGFIVFTKKPESTSYQFVPLSETSQL